ncbi:hypothetical protein V8F20_005063 [Naviculisporaceae sp. PSN 640]
MHSCLLTCCFPSRTFRRTTDIPRDLRYHSPNSPVQVHRNTGSTPCTPASKVMSESAILHTPSAEYPPSQMVQKSTSIPAQVPLEDPFWDPYPRTTDIDREQDGFYTTRRDSAQDEEDGNRKHSDYEDISNDNQSTPNPGQYLHIDCSHSEHEPPRNKDPAVVSLKTAADYEAYAMRRFHTLPGTSSSTCSKRRWSDGDLNDNDFPRKRAASEITCMDRMTETWPAVDSGQADPGPQYEDELDYQVSNLSLYAEPETQDGYEADIDWSGLVWDGDWVRETHDGDKSIHMI